MFENFRKAIIFYELEEVMVEIDYLERGDDSFKMFQQPMRDRKRHKGT